MLGKPQSESHLVEIYLIVRRYLNTLLEHTFKILNIKIYIYFLKISNSVTFVILFMAHVPAIFLLNCYLSIDLRPYLICSIFGLTVVFFFSLAY